MFKVQTWIIIDLKKANIRITAWHRQNVYLQIDNILLNFYTTIYIIVLSNHVNLFK